MEDECIDDAKNEIFIDFNDRIDFNQLCELLNKLAEENKKLKSELDEFREVRRKEFEIGNGRYYWE